MTGDMNDDDDRRRLQEWSAACGQTMLTGHDPALPPTGFLTEEPRTIYFGTEAYRRLMNLMRDEGVDIDDRRRAFRREFDLRN